MNRASSVDIRKAILVANEFVKAGIDFVPVPVLSDDDKPIMVREVQKRLSQIENDSEGNNGCSPP